MLQRIFTFIILVIMFPSLTTHADTSPKFAQLAVITPDNVRFIEDLRTVPIDGSVQDIVWSPDDSLLAVADDNDILLFDALDWGKSPRRLKGHQSTIWDLSFSPDGKSLASSSGLIALEDGHAVDNTARIWDVEQGYARVVINHLADEQIVRNVSFYDNGKQIVTVSIDHDVLRYWDSKTGKFLQAYSIEPPDHWPWILANGFSEDGSLYGLGTIHNEFRLWRLMPAPEVVKLPPFVQYGAALTFSTDSRYMAIASRYGVEAAIYDFADKSAYQANTHYELFGAQAFDSTAKLLFQSTYSDAQPDPLVRIREISRNEQIALINPLGNAKIAQFAFSHNGKLLIMLMKEWHSPISELHLWGIPIQ